MSGNKVTLSFEGLNGASERLVCVLQKSDDGTNKINILEVYERYEDVIQGRASSVGKKPITAIQAKALQELFAFSGINFAEGCGL